MKHIILVLSIVISLISATLQAWSAVPPMINYQGKLTGADGRPIADGAYAVTFAIYPVPIGGVALWSETNTAVQVKGGLFNVLLGSVINLPANIFDAPDRFFGVQVGTDAEMTPRQQIASVPFAVRAESADTATKATQADRAATADAAAIADTVKDGAITTSKLADGVVTTGKLSDGSITTTKIADANVTIEKLASGSVGNKNILNAAVTTEKISQKSITADKVNSDVIKVYKFEVNGNQYTASNQFQQVTSQIVTAPVACNVIVFFSGCVQNNTNIVQARQIKLSIGGISRSTMQVNLDARQYDQRNASLIGCATNLPAGDILIMIEQCSINSQDGGFFNAVPREVTVIITPA